MADGSQIQWTDATWNPVTGCTKVSPGCANCYIERTPAFRISGRKFVKGATDLRLHEDRLGQPLRWRKPRRVFVNSLSDLFHQDVPDWFIDLVFLTMADASHHWFQVLTKRIERALAYMRSRSRADDGHVVVWSKPPREVARGVLEGEKRRIRWPLSNVWLGVSVENQHFADKRIPLLLQTPAAVRFISAEPLLGLVDIESYMSRNVLGVNDAGHGLDWVIVGGESGPKSRPFNWRWAESIVRQCRAAGVACFVKQMGSNAKMPQPCGDCDPCGAGQPCSLAYDLIDVLRDRKGGDPTEWPEDLRVREFPTEAV